MNTRFSPAPEPNQLRKGTQGGWRRTSPRRYRSLARQTAAGSDDRVCDDGRDDSHGRRSQRERPADRAAGTRGHWRRVGFAADHPAGHAHYLRADYAWRQPDGNLESLDDGESWSLHGFPKFAERDAISYCRGVAVKPDDPDTVFVANGDFIPGKRGAIHRTRDGGKTWTKAGLPVEPNSTIYWFATNRANPDIIAANSLHGYLYLSTDAGDSWTKLRREFGEIRALAWLPN
jgi:Sortilin, neurotensin receptor 3,